MNCDGDSKKDAQGLLIYPKNETLWKSDIFRHFPTHFQHFLTFSDIFRHFLTFSDSRGTSQNDGVTSGGTFLGVLANVCTRNDDILQLSNIMAFQNVAAHISVYPRQRKQ